MLRPCALRSVAAESVGLLQMAIERSAEGRMGAIQVVTIGVDELERVVERAVDRALDARAPAPAPSEPPEPGPVWLTTKQVAELIGCHEKSVAALVARGLPRRELGPKTMRYERGAVLAWLAERDNKRRR